MRQSSTRYVLLGVLAVGGPLTGFEIRAFIEQSVKFFWRESFGQIYPELESLASDGLIKAAGSSSADSGRRTKPWEITPLGRDELRQWLDQPPQDQIPRDELLLKMFLSRHGSPATQRRLIEGARERAAHRLQGLEAALQLILTDPADPETVTSLMVLRRGVLAARAQVQWADDAQQILDLWQAGGAASVLDWWRQSS